MLETREATFSYDEEGNLIQKVESNGDMWQYEYFGNGMMSKVIRPDNTEVTFKYDSLGRRIEKCSDEKTISFVWDGNTLLHEYVSEKASTDVEGEKLVTWVYDGESFTPSAKITCEGSYSIISDYLGTPVEAYDEQGKKVWSATLDIYGRVKDLLGEQDFIPFRYQGQYEDEEIGLYYNRFRYYDLSTGTYTQIDPIGLSGGMVLYGYVKDTNTQFDPLGWITVYRALTDAQESQALNNEPITPKNSKANYSIQEHIDDGNLRTQYLSTTKKKHTAERYAQPNPKRGKMTSSTIIAIDTDKLDPNKVFDVSNGIDPQTDKSFRKPAVDYAKKDAEVLIQGEIPKSAYTIHKKGRCR
ncbi:RHS repeat-associated core domain-containing protein [Metasolibacillus meyeri]|uniref:RHS repeat-associated core domain-containing protein n=1 Tax=Metasolibacillus meyeri TaxID=1071052 RepID=A0AAW9NR26_9BACL|nr:RHS repeat-associated core domain-containing protein [Metasolibacillus meyeri]MEC1180002.1 RHS repeat-associated core domain-containing protein [Metasolibacillus meyeri]